MKSYDAIIIGGGHNGLVTAAYLGARREESAGSRTPRLVGGCAVTEEIWPGYRVSTAAYLSQPAAGSNRPGSGAGALRLPRRRERPGLLLAIP